MFEFNLSDISINSIRCKSFKVQVQYSVLLPQVVKEAAIRTPPSPLHRSYTSCVYIRRVLYGQRASLYKHV